MTTYIRPSADHTRLTALERIAQKGAQAANSKITYLRPETLDQVTALVPQFAAAVDNANDARSAQAAATAAARTAIKLVSQYIQDIWVGRQTAHQPRRAAGGRTAPLWLIPQRQVAQN
jgi:hypothetical protein